MQVFNMYLNIIHKNKKIKKKNKKIINKKLLSYPNTSNKLTILIIELTLQNNLVYAPNNLVSIPIL